MLTDTLVQLFERDLNRLKEEISKYNNEKALWFVDGEIANSGGNLCLHLVGNLNHFIGAILGNTNYKRDRDAEFNLLGVSRIELINKVEDTLAMIKEVLPTLSQETMDGQYPLEVFGKPMSTEYFLVHLEGHLNYHLGQLNYHRRLLDVMAV